MTTGSSAHETRQTRHRADGSDRGSPWISTKSAGPPSRRLAQLDAGADFIKLYLDGANPEVCPWTIGQIGGSTPGTFRGGPSRLWAVTRAPRASGRD